MKSNYSRFKIYPENYAFHKVIEINTLLNLEKLSKNHNENKEADIFFECINTIDFTGLLKRQGQ
jgi:hypothetical protein